MSRTLRKTTGRNLTQPIWSPSIACAMIFGYPQHMRNGQGAANVEDLGSHATEKHM